VALAGVDALIVQDPAVALLARRICPELEIHASTQMTISSPEASRFAETLGVTRVVVPRELSVNEIRQFAAGTELELEVFVMGALCMAWSGQCLSSEAWGGRSANRGKCAQACRLPYDLIVDGRQRDLGDVQYLLSPQDLAGFRAVEQLMEIGVHTLKIEGRQKNASYVHHAVSSLKGWRDSVKAGSTDPERLAADLRDLSLVYSRGLSDGFLAGSDHQALVEGETPRHKGIRLGQVVKVKGKRVLVDSTPPSVRSVDGEVSSPLPSLGESSAGPPVAPLIPQRGMGVVFRQGEEQEKEQGGPIFAVQRQGERYWLQFGKPGPNLSKVRVGAQVYVTSDPGLAVKPSGEPDGRLGLSLTVEGALGRALRVVAKRGQLEVTQESTVDLQEARNRDLDEAVLKENLGALGGTPFYLERLDLELEKGLFLPLSQLREIRRSLVERILPYFEKGRPKTVAPGPHLNSLRAEPVKRDKGSPYLVALCRTEQQLEAAISAGISEVELDWMELVGLNGAVKKAREVGLKVGLATVRIQKPGEEAYDRRIEKLQPDSVLLRHWAGVMHFLDKQERPVLHGDFSLNVTNSVTAKHLLEMGLETLTASHDLDENQLLNLLGAVDPKRIAITIHHHIPTFHTEHCVYSALLSNGRDFRSCGRPCEEHEVSLRDRVDLEHPVIVDVGCRNTVFNAQAQSAAFLVPNLVSLGVERLRVEFVRESFDDSLTVLKSYEELLRGEIDHRTLLSRVDCLEQFGVTRGTMEILV